MHWTFYSTLLKIIIIYLQEKLKLSCSNFRFFNSIVLYMQRSMIIILIIIHPSMLMNFVESCTGWETRCYLDRSPVYHTCRYSDQLTENLWFPTNVTCTSCMLNETLYKYRERSCTLHTEMTHPGRFKLRSFLLEGDIASHWATLLPAPLIYL